MRAAVRLEAVIAALPAGIGELQAEARAEGYKMLERLAADWNCGTTRFDQPGEALLAARVEGGLAGIGGLTADPGNPTLLRMRRFYVRRRFRQIGIGRELAGALLERATRDGRAVAVNAAAGSGAFWEALGFKPDRRNGHTHIFAGPEPPRGRPV
ncbi:MAG: GNAT family N-acetyltransferase [Alphaproteobacteria bacterium]|nr:GNAT family N-acetyltransferase [Alphaproteobacteria bacterium]